MEGEALTGMAALLADLATVITSVMSNVSTIATTITSTPLLLLTTGFLFIGKMSADVKSGKNGENLEQTTPCYAA